VAEQTYESGLYSQQRALSYVEILSSQRAAQAVVEELGLAESVETVQEKIAASVSPNSILINVTVSDRSPVLAKSIADSVGEQLPMLVDGLETPQGGRLSPIRVTVTRPARLPTDPVAPRKPIYLALGALIGLAAGIGIAVLRRNFDRRIRDGADASITAGAPILGKIPEYPDRKLSPVMLADPYSAAAEGYRGLRENVRAISSEHDLRSFVVSSAVEAEGKTEVVANLGIALAQAGERVVVIDANLRSPRLLQLLGMRPSIGLTDLIAVGRPLDLVLRRHQTVPLAVLTGGSRQSNPSKVLESEAFGDVINTLTKWFSFVIVDTPALLAAADAAVIAQRTSAVLLVAHSASTYTDELEAARRELHAFDRRPLGIVLNRARERDSRQSREDPLPPHRSRSGTGAPVRHGRRRSLAWKL
jgi:capsular exopolysaccharide synthesis family protein